MINLNEVRTQREKLKNEQIEQTKDDVSAAVNRFSMKQENGVATQDDFYQCLREIGLAQKKRKEILEGK